MKYAIIFLVAQSMISDLFFILDLKSGNESETIINKYRILEITDKSLYVKMMSLFQINKLIVSI